jgi:hypothetical protein
MTGVCQPLHYDCLYLVHGDTKTLYQNLGGPALLYLSVQAAGDDQSDQEDVLILCTGTLH